MGVLLDGQGPGGVKIVTTDTTGKTGTAGCSFDCRRPSRPGSDAAVQALKLMQAEGGVPVDGQTIRRTRKVLNMKDAATQSEEGEKE